MSSVHEIETAVGKLSPRELSAFREWFSEFDAAIWDKQFEEDAAAGPLDALADEAIRDLREGRCRKTDASETLTPREALRKLQEDARKPPEQAEDYLHELREERLAVEVPSRA